MRASWGLLEASGGLLGGFPGVVLGRVFSGISFGIDFSSQRGPPKEPKRHPKGTQNGAKRAPEASQNRSRFSRAKKTCIETVLEPSWVDFGWFGAPSWAPKHQFRIGKRRTGAKSAFFKKMSYQKAFWAEFGPTSRPKSSKMIPQKAPKTSPKRSRIVQKSSPKNDGEKHRFLIEFGGPSTPPQRGESTA